MSTIKQLKPEEYSEARKQAMQEIESKNKPLEESKTKEIQKLRNKPSEASKTTKTEIIKKEPDKKLIADIIKLYAKYYERARVQTIMYYWELGKRLNKEYGSPKKAGNPNLQPNANWGDSARQLIKKLKEIGIKICERNISYARKFAFKFPQIQELIKQQDMNWKKITTKLLLEKKKEIELKSDFNNTVITNFKRWNKFVDEFYNAIPKIDFSKAKKEEKQECVKILKDSIKKLQKRMEELK